MQLLHAAFSEYGSPVGIVSDNGSVFTADAYRQLLRTLQIEPCYAERGLAKHGVAIWIYADRLNIEYQQTKVARYQCILDH